MTLLVSAALSVSCGGVSGAAPDTPRARAASSQLSGAMRFGVGDRLTIERGRGWTTLVSEARRFDVPLDLLAIWLPRGWSSEWLPRDALDALVAAGTTPVLVHYFFGDAMSKERVLRERGAWHASLRRLGGVARSLPGALVVLEPEFNDAPSSGETATLDWPGFAAEIRTAAAIVRSEAPSAQIGICAGDFQPDLDLDVLRAASDSLDFIAFQEMRAITDPERGRKGYLNVGSAALRYARYLRRAFGKPILLAYVAVSSHGGWESQQVAVLQDLGSVQPALEQAGVFGLMYFQLFDDPAHTGHFGPAERSFGLLDAAGFPKPALTAFKALAAGRLSRPADSRSAATRR